ncbi:hypothetical protein E4T42_03531 [Aureobasidium subglaciale]|uniref:Guanine nucleotide exchange factor synembryn-like protein n=1 Tax=Aureobasidium subglaciale (strain EXF-2481) TaxID=1043005 RepID=A0A074YW22_AURSE|nr:uncharacterized protein AUEXF2481DRAFT_2314 [Aureobasidium subglaciale EXF-2481]KAI5211990.1 hypothetical protein E4T38_01001 [Aureobasidium subglaciale]KAI5230761.1 hypothetical protein E4T40_01002 [Aureobasidium subglaciale]KAI5233756.1 hypothetical protein E4T41_01000 [Aureobasidium subglaciale]KAI5252275.1 hypothetical protein E4T42_03531 [Aureobasidium subglaciale]KAI5267341.1 hypothetical protein E4T46_01000 [Aureobasidium subglaciale]
MYSRPSQNSAQDKAKVDELLTQLTADLQDEKLTAAQRKNLLEQLKVLGRNPANSDSIFAKKGIETLCEYGFDVAELDVSQEALRCLANAMLLQEAPRQHLLDLGYRDKAAQRLRNNDRDDEFLVSRIIFLLTYKTTVDLEDLVEKNELASSISRNIAGHADRLSDSAGQPAHPMDDMALVESLKLLFNVTAKKPELIARFASCVPDLFSILSHQKLPVPSLQVPVNSIISALMNMHITKETCPTETLTKQLINILDLSIEAYPETQLELAATPLLTLLRKIQAVASQDGRKHIQSLLLPNEQDRAKPLGQGDSLSSRLLRLSISPSLNEVRESISALFFELSDSDPTTFIHNIGYGYAAGFLSTHQIEVPETMMRTDAQGAAVNPVTGQRLAAESENPEPEMTDEEKECEAERLFVLFERLKATGVVNVENPVHQAMREGRFDN